MMHERTWEKTFRDVDSCRNILLRIDASTLDQRALRLSKESCVLMPLGYSMPTWTSKLIDEAGTCFSNGQYTGCIVSLAAGVEFGLRELNNGKPNHQLGRLIRDAYNSEKIYEAEREALNEMTRYRNDVLHGNLDHLAAGITLERQIAQLTETRINEVTEWEEYEPEEQYEKEMASHFAAAARVEEIFLRVRETMFDVFDRNPWKSKGFDDVI